MNCTRITVTPLYPGSFMPEEGRPVEIPDADTSTALAAVPDDGQWFAIEVRSTPVKRWTDGEGGERWLPDGESLVHRIYVGETLTADDIEQWPDADRYSILLANMRGNDWERVVRTRRGNFQPINPADVVLPAPAEVTR